jgi:hypothetical protein
MGGNPWSLRSLPYGQKAIRHLANPKARDAVRGTMWYQQSGNGSNGVDLERPRSQTDRICLMQAPAYHSVLIDADRDTHFDTLLRVLMLTVPVDFCKRWTPCTHRSWGESRHVLTTRYRFNVLPIDQEMGKSHCHVRCFYMTFYCKLAEMNPPRDFNGQALPAVVSL